MTAKEFMTMQSFITKFQDLWVAGATGFQGIQDALRTTTQSQTIGSLIPQTKLL
jgi:hypothetical protein